MHTSSRYGNSYGFTNFTVHPTITPIPTISTMYKNLCMNSIFFILFEWPTLFNQFLV